jgi:glycerophosphoryl diester phosphodiesterase
MEKPVEQPANLLVRKRIAALAPAANLGHRGSGVSVPGRQLPENSIPSFLRAMQHGAHGVELDVEITADGQLVVMHDDTLDRTTTCTGCVSALGFDTLRHCRLRDGNGGTTAERPPALAEVYSALPPSALVNVELKVYEPRCRTASTGPRQLARAAVAEIKRLGVADRTIFSSFDEDAIVAVKTADATLYAALLFFEYRPERIEHAVQLGLDAIHPYHTIAATEVQRALQAGLQVNVWTVNARPHLLESLEKGVSAIITDHPELLHQVRAEMPPRLS